MKKFFSRLTTSQRGEKFNPLIWPFFISIFSYGLAFTFFASTDVVSRSSLFAAMVGIHTLVPVIWGAIAMLTIICGFTFLLFNIPPAGKASGLFGFMIWVFASFCWGLDGNMLLVFAVGVPNMWFWIWQYLSLSLFRREEAEDLATMRAYNNGEYDDDNGGKNLRLTNRGQDIQ